MNRPLLVVLFVLVLIGSTFLPVIANAQQTGEDYSRERLESNLRPSGNAGWAIRSEPDLGPYGTSGWTFLAQSMSTRRYGLTAVTGLDGRIYAIGGSNGASSTIFLDLVEVYDPVNPTNGWITVKHMPTARWAPGAAVGSDGKIYVIGGDLSNTAVNAVEAYSPGTNTWTTGLAPLPTPRWGLAVVNGPNGLIYAIGGASGCVWPCLTALSTVEAYSPSANTWKTLADLPIALAYAEAVLGTDQRIYLFGGQGNDQHMVSTVEVYTPATNKWDYVNTNMPTALASFGLVLGSNGLIYVIGGGGYCPPYFGCPVTSVESYDLSTNTWKTSVPSLNTPRLGLGATVGSDGTIYAIGGCQGGYDCYVNTVEAYTPSNPPLTPTITSYSLSSYSIQEGGSFTATYYISNPRSSPVTVYLGASLRISGTSTEIHDSDHDNVTLTVPANSINQEGNRIFTVPPSTSSGSYDYALAIWSGVPGSSTQYSTSGWQIGALTVTYFTPPTIGSDNSLSPESVVVGSQFIATYSITNVNSFPITVGLGLSIRRSGCSSSSCVIPDPHDDKMITVMPGTGQYQRPFTIPSSASVGSYDWMLALWSGTPGSSVEYADTSWNTVGLSVTAPTVNVVLQGRLDKTSGTGAGAIELNGLLNVPLPTTVQLPAGQYPMSAAGAPFMPTGYAFSTWECTGGVRPSSTLVSTTLTVSSSGGCTAVYVPVPGIGSGVGDLSITVLDSSNSPADGAVVTATQGPQSNLKGTTNIYGIVLFQNIALGSYIFEAQVSSPTGFVYESGMQTVQVLAEGTAVATIDLNQGSSPTTSKPTIHITVEDINGVPLQKAGVLVCPPSNPGCSATRENTGSDGSIEILNADNGYYNIIVIVDSQTSMVSTSTTNPPCPPCTPPPSAYSKQFGPYQAYAGPVCNALSTTITSTCEYDYVVRVPELEDELYQMSFDPQPAALTLNQTLEYSGVLEDHSGNPVPNVCNGGTPTSACPWVDDPLTYSDQNACNNAGGHWVQLVNYGACRRYISTDSSGHFKYDLTYTRSGAFSVPFGIGSRTLKEAIASDQRVYAFPALQFINNSPNQAVTFSWNGVPFLTLQPGDKSTVTSVRDWDISPMASVSVEGDVGVLTVGADNTGEFQVGGSLPVAPTPIGAFSVEVGVFNNPTEGDWGYNWGTGVGVPYVYNVDGGLFVVSKGERVSWGGEAGTGVGVLKGTISLTISTSVSTVIRSNANSPVALLVTDPIGQRVGFDPGSGYYGEIPGAMYSGPYVEPQTLVLGQPTPGTYDVKIFPLDNGSFTFDFSALAGIGAVSNVTYTGLVTVGVPLEMQFTVNGEGRDMRVYVSTAFFSPASGYVAVTFHTNPSTEGSINWGSCSGTSYTDGQTLSTPGGSFPVCYVPAGYTFASWTCSPGLSCLGSNDPTVVTVSGTGSITLNLKTGSLSKPVSTSLTASASYPSPGKFTVSGTLTANGAGLGGEAIVLVFGWSRSIVTVTTNSTGSIGSYTYAATAPRSTGSYNVDAFFLGDYSGSLQYLPSKATGLVSVS